MNIINRSISWYIDKLERGEHFCLGRYGDGEWLAIFREHFSRAAQGTVVTPKLREALKQSINYRHKEFYFATNELCFRNVKEQVESLDIEFLECQMWDTASRMGKLVPFIKQIQSMDTCIISNESLKKLRFLKYAEFIEIPHPNWFDRHYERVVSQIEQLGSEYVYLVSAGIPAAILVQDIQKMFGEVTALDLGSIWDAFVGIGSQRGWRRELYSSPKKYAEWKNLYEEVL